MRSEKIHRAASHEAIPTSVSEVLRLLQPIPKHIGQGKQSRARLLAMQRLAELYLPFFQVCTIIRCVKLTTN